MKKVIALLAVGAFALAIVACGKKADEAATTEDTTKVETVAPATDTTATDTTATDTTTVQ